MSLTSAAVPVDLAVMLMRSPSLMMQCLSLAGAALSSQHIVACAPRAAFGQLLKTKCEVYSVNWPLELDRTPPLILQQ